MAFVPKSILTIKIPQEITKVIEPIISRVPESSLVFYDNTWKVNKTSRFEISMSDKNIKYFLSKYKDVQTSKAGGKEVHDFDINEWKIRVRETSKKSNSADANTTRMQELGSAWIMRQAVKKNKKYKDYKELLQDKDLKELCEIYPGVADDLDWLNTFVQQQKTLLTEFSNTSFSEINREGGFMDWISNLVKTKYGISKKDTWNPADMWLLKDASKVESDILKHINSKNSSLNELNNILRKMFKERRVVGISLKKMSGKTALYQELNVDESDLLRTYTYDVKEISIKLKCSNGKFDTQDSRIVVEGSGTSYDFQMKGNDTKSYSNLKWEPTSKGQNAARVGKAPVAMVIDLMKQYGMKFDNNWKNHPSTIDEWMKQKDKYVSMFKNVKSKVKTDTTSVEQFVDYMTMGFGGKTPFIANVKLLQLSFIDKLCSVSKNDLNEFMSDMIYISAKKGEKFGPFGKLY